MSIRILHDTDQGIACLYCSTSGFAFGPIFEGHDDGRTAFEMAELFLSSLRRDARCYSPEALADMHAAWARTAYQEVELG